MKRKSVILVVDDQSKNAELLEAHLVPQGFKVVKAASGEEALNILSGNQIDLVLLDIMMPRMSGYEVLEKIRADKTIRLIPVVMVTALKATEDKINALEAGCDDFISKPFDRHELLARVKSLLRIKSLHDEVKEARTYAENIINTVREPLIVLDQDLRVASVSRSFYDFFKVKPEETVGQLIYDLGNKQWDIPELRELLENILPEKTAFDNYEVEHDFATIGRRTMLLNARQIEQAMGKERIILLAIEDITERRQLEDLLTESEFRYRRLFETASDGIVLLEKKEGHVAHANAAIEKMLGYSEAECLGKKLQHIGVSIDTRDFSETMQDLDREGILNYNDVSLKTKTGREIYTDIYMVDRAQLAQCNIRDISERKQTEEKLRESEKRFRDISHSMADWIWEVDKKGHYTFVSDTVKNVLGYDSHELIGKTPFDLMPEEECAKRKTSFFKIASKSLPISDLENWNLAKDGTRVCLLTNGIPISDEDGTFQGYRGVNKDITRQKQNEAEKASIEDQLRQAQKMEFVGRLAGGVAHDYNNALSVIIGFTELAMDAMDPTEPAHEYFNEVLKAAIRATDITRQLLAYARKQTIAPKVLNLNENMESMLKMVRRLIGEDITLAWLPEANLPSVKMDPSQIDQILANLCINARDAIPGVGKITIETKKVTFDTDYCADHRGFIPGRFVMLAVSDNGCGMDKEIQKSIFEPFFTTKDVDKGTGLGLSTVYGIVKQNNGFINVYSEPGAGTTIKIYLPQHKDNAIDIRWQDTEEIPSGHGETVMVVEDDPSILKLTETILKGLGYIVLTANRPQKAMKLVKEHVGEIHLILTDVIMPEMNGLELIDSIQSLYPNLKRVFMSGYTSDAIAHHGVFDGGINFVQKPFSKKDLAKTVRKALGEGTIGVQG
jgi:two-component system, cell cycle sensor histidine kinase and response regulator CckA